MEAANEMFEEELKGLWQAQHGLAVNHEGCNLFATIIHNLALVSRWVVAWHRGWGAVVAEAAIHELVHKVQIVGSGGPDGSPVARVEEGWGMS